MPAPLAWGSPWSGRNPRYRRRALRRRCSAAWETPGGLGGRGVRRPGRGCEGQGRGSVWIRWLVDPGSGLQILVLNGRARTTRVWAGRDKPATGSDSPEKSASGRTGSAAPYGSCMPGPGLPARALRPAECTAAGAGEKVADMHGTSPAGCGNRSIRVALCSRWSRIAPGSGVLRCVPIPAHPSAAGDRRAPVSR